MSNATQYLAIDACSQYRFLQQDKNNGQLYLLENKRTTAFRVYFIITGNYEYAINFGCKFQKSLYIFPGS